MRTSKLDWELYKEQLLQLRAEGQSLTAINKVLFEKLGFCYSNARLSQKFKEWGQPIDPYGEKMHTLTEMSVEELLEEQINAN